MKTALMTLALVLCGCLCYAQPTNPKKNDGICAEKWCMDMKFKYTFCNSEGKAVTKCSNDPNNEPGLKLAKRRLPINYEFDDFSLRPEITGGDDTISFYEGDPLNYYEYPMFVGSNFTNAIAQAAQRWMTNLCPPQGPDDEYQDCLVSIRWTFYNENIGDVFALTDYDVYGDAAGNCRVDCGSTQIVLNQEPRFTFNDDYGRPIRFIATERMNYGHLPRMTALGEEYVYMDAYTLMVHEFGHWLGFPHSDSADSYGNTCGDPNSIMHGVIGNLQQKDLTPADECMFLKAYCCEQSQRGRPVTHDPRDPNDPPYDGTKTVIAPDVQEGFTVLPNPSRSGTLTLRLMLPEESGAGNIRLVNAAGTVVLYQQLVDAGGKEVSLDVSRLSTGMYMVQVSFAGHAFSRKVIIE